MNRTIFTRTWVRGSVAALLIAFLSGCQTGDSRRVGGVIGSVTGSYLGYQLGGSSTAGRLAGAVAGSLAGYYLGTTIAGYLEEGDRNRMSQASQAAFETNQTQTFSNPDNGVQGKAEVVSPTQATQQGQECKTIRQTIVLKNGDTVTEDVKSCK
ncbi:glycine zipper 2TM domain-containing protein [Nitrosovibrio sp. Nv17]|uniref:glycine zipper 2TM domain-containing protein n=1 Tax=Nitrosovibrio sp. Nv17 TaxID=1855339 RepID=UPI000908B0E2|nr:glycine zipper 2TM domain-containing protein [Nitrosovibrio sp. Nv17]SFW23341.1 hypothetical protein SAMN05216414_10768 [Nitrosovibrio sp. Nv17]